MLGRETDWRQGSILSDEYAHSIGLIQALNSPERMVVITHDCDIPYEKYPNIQLIRSVIVDKENAQYTSARNPRTLHLRLNNSNGQDVYVELNYSNLVDFPKEKLVDSESLDQILSLSQDEKRTLKQWLAARYGRPAFPNSFENRLRRKLGKKNVEHHIAQIIALNSNYLVGVFFDLDEDRDQELSEDQPYLLNISIVYDAVEGGTAARESAEKVSAELHSLFTRAYGDAEGSGIIMLDKCSAVADTHFSLSDLRKVDQWRLEYISLRESDAGDYLNVSESLT